MQSVSSSEQNCNYFFSRVKLIKHKDCFTAFFSPKVTVWGKSGLLIELDKRCCTNPYLPEELPVISVYMKLDLTSINYPNDKFLGELQSDLFWGDFKFPKDWKMCLFGLGNGGIFDHWNQRTHSWQDLQWVQEYIRKKIRLRITWPAEGCQFGTKCR